MENQRLKKLFKQPPFKWSGDGKIQLSDYTYLQLHSQNLLNTDYLNFVCDALNEKFMRIEKGEPKGLGDDAMASGYPG